MSKAVVAFAVIAIAMLLAGCGPKAPAAPQDPGVQQPSVSEPAPVVDDSFDDYSDLDEDPDPGMIEDLPETELVVP